MLKILSVFHLDDPASLKRFIVTTVGGLVLLVAQVAPASWHIPAIPDTALELFAGVVVTYLLQSGANSATQKLAEAHVAASASADAVVTVDDANKALEVKP